MKNAALIRQAKALLELDEAGALVPHGIGGLGRKTIERLVAALETPDAPTDEQIKAAGAVLAKAWPGGLEDETNQQRPPNTYAISTVFNVIAALRS